MDVGIFYSGEFGKRFVSNFAYPYLCPTFGACGIDGCDYCRRYDFSANLVYVKELPEPSAIGLYVDDAGVFLENFSCDVAIAINIHPDLLISLPEFGDFSALIVPACNQNWCLPGLRKQLEEKCRELGIEFTSPKPFCILEADPENPEGSGLISEFCNSFSIGKPEFKVLIDDGIIRKVEVLRSDPCGSAYYVAKRMVGYIIEDVNEFWKEIHQHQCAYPCMASMERDVELKEAPFHLAGYIMVYQFSKAAGIDARRFVPEHFRSVVCAGKML